MYEHHTAPLLPRRAFRRRVMRHAARGFGEIHSTPGKLFASFFALYAGLVFLAVGAIVLAPVIHRFLHRFHLAEAQRSGHDHDSQGTNR